MIETRSADSQSLTGRIDAACDRFEAEWKAGRRPRIEDYLDAVPAPGREELLRELLVLELTYRARGREDPTPDEYRDRFAGPDAAMQVEAAFAMIKSRTTTSPRGPAGPGPAGRCGEPPPCEGVSMPATIGKYAVVRLLGKGSQGRVFLVQHPELGHELVLKLARRPLAKGVALRSLLADEGRILVTLKHPNLVRVVDLDFHQDWPCLVMEYVPGSNLKQYNERRRLAPRRAAALVAQLARVLEYAHGRGVIHQDIKPQNILIEEEGERPRLIDFGLSRLRDAWMDDREGPSGGTPAYMAPEQALGEWERVGPASDVFALGGVLYFLLTGHAPFEGRDVGEAVARACRNDFDRAALRAPGIPRRLARLVERAMASEPRDRPDAAELARELERLAARPRWLGVGTAAAFVASTVVTWFLMTRPIAPASPLEIAELRVELHRREPPQPLGEIGSDVFAGRYEDDDVRVHARLTTPSYCYLIALNADGKDQLCFPADEATAPPPSADINFPADPTKGFGLTDGVGLQSFVLVASGEPLPPYRAWRSHLGDLSWRATEIRPGWQYDGQHFEPLNGRRLKLPPEKRGDIRELRDLPASFADACRALQAPPGIAAIQAVAFPVLPRGAGDPPPAPGTSR
jgi:serine/threonine protein kinase